jgi:hypothetical protein
MGVFKSEFCSNCKKQVTEETRHDFVVPHKTCAITHAILIGESDVVLCDRCFKKKGKPIEVYIGRIIYENDGKFSFDKGGQLGGIRLI